MTGRIRWHISRGASGVLALLLAALVLAAPVRVAYARVPSDEVYIDIEQVDIDATLGTTGDLSVHEVRTFDGSFNGVYWYLPRGEYEGTEIETTVVEVGVLRDGEAHPFEQDDSGQDNTYQLDFYSDAVRVKVFHETYESTEQIYVVYTSTDVARRYEDCSELYWQFVTQGWDSESQNVTCTVHLPVPEGREVEPEENVRAWGHGPADAEVRFDGNDVVFVAPGVGSSEYAEARITMPASWLADAPEQEGEVLQDILDEEQRWADEANQARERARFITYGGGLMLGLGSILCLIWPFVAYARYKRTHKPHFDDTYFRDVPSDDHPAVLGALYHDGDVESEALTATLMRLTDMGAIRLDAVKIPQKGLLGRKKKDKEDYRLSCPPETADKKLDRIDRQALHLMFLDLARRAPKHDDIEPGEEALYFSDLESVARRHPSAFESAYDGWKAQVEAEVSARRFFHPDRPTGQGQAIAAVICSGLLLAASFFYAVTTGAWAIGGLLILVEIVALIAGLVMVAQMQGLSDEAIELKAQLVALRKWLQDFTRLEEAVPRDVVLWNRLLVMAVALGVADEVIEQLRVHVPEVLQDPMMQPMYGWYYGGAGRTSAIRSFDHSYAQAHSVSTAKLAKSSMSSGSGGGGGFSSGGGGGFGGGGGGHSGGGAF